MVNTEDDYYILSDEEEFIRTNLSFLIESDEEFFEDSDEEDSLIHVLTYADENTIYGKSSISSKVTETWSLLSGGAISSSRVIPPKISVNTNLIKWSDPELGQSFEPNFSFKKDLHQTKLSTFINKPMNNNQDVGVEIDKKEMTSYLKKSKVSIPLTRASVTPLNELNMLSLSLNEKNTEVAKEMKLKVRPSALSQVKNKIDEKKSGCEICLKEAGPKSLTLADFLKKPESKSESHSKDAKQTKQSNVDKENNFCQFCYKNGELMEVFTSHITKKPDGTVFCPILRNYVCELCGQTGDNAHTRKYCALNPERFQRKPLYRRLSNGVLTSSHNHK